MNSNPPIAFPKKTDKIAYSIEDTQFPDYKTAAIYSEEEPENLFVSLDIHGVGTKKISAYTTIIVPEKFMRDISQKIGIDINDLVAIGRAPEYTS